MLYHGRRQILQDFQEAIYRQWMQYRVVATQLHSKLTSSVTDLARRKVAKILLLCGACMWHFLQWWWLASRLHKSYKQVKHCIQTPWHVHFAKPDAGSRTASHTEVLLPCSAACGTSCDQHGACIIVQGKSDVRFQ